MERPLARFLDFDRVIDDGQADVEPGYTSLLVYGVTWSAAVKREIDP